MKKNLENTVKRLYNNFETTQLLDAVDVLDKGLRAYLNDGSRGEPPSIRDELLNLHTMVFDIVNGSSLEIRKMVELTDNLEYTMNDIIEAAEKIRDTLSELTNIVGNDGYEEDESE
jgi:hypothetical protein